MKPKISILISLFFLAVITIQCSDDDGIEQQGQVSVAITDAPSDDANIQGTFVTISEVRVDGQAIEGYSPQTIDISAYQQGNTKLLVNEDFEAGTHSNVTLVFDYKNDAQGNTPGCYVLTDDNTKHALESSSTTQMEIKFNRAFDVVANGMTDLVVDFDLRKAVVRDEDTSTESSYKFVSSAELSNSMRIVEKEECGVIEGQVNNHAETNGELVVYAYKKGTYNENTETQGQGESQVLFANAITSAKVENDGSYQLSFLEAGEYEIHMASYTKDENGEVSFNGSVDASSSISGMLLNSIQVEAQSRINLNIDISVLF